MDNTPEFETTDRLSIEILANDQHYDHTDVVRCHSCYPDSVEVAQFSKTIAILQGPDGWFLLEQPGHSHHVVATLGQERPIPDPDPSIGEDGTPEEEAAMDAFYETPEGHLQFEAGSKWVAVAEKAVIFTPTSHPEHYWALVQEMIETGYNSERDGYFALWIYNRTGKILAELDAASQGVSRSI